MAKKAVAISFANLRSVNRPPIAITCASLWSRASCANSTVLAKAARMPWTLFAAMSSPLPDPPSTMPREPASAATALAARRTKTG